jgi:hypothetical protein
MNEDSFFSRILGRDANEDEGRTDSAEAFGIRRSKTRNEPEVGEQPWDSAVNLVVETIDDLPSNFPRESAIRIVKRTLSAAGIEIGDFNRRTWARMPQIDSEMELARSRDKEFKEKTEEDIRSLEGEIRKAREAYETIHAKEEGEISRASKELENVKRVRAFFGFSDMDSNTEGDENTSASDEAPEVRGPLGLGSVQQSGAFFSSPEMDAFFSSPEMEGGENAEPSGAQTEVRDFLDATWAQIGSFRAQMSQPVDPDAGADRPTRGPTEDSSPYSDPQDIQR